jgi:UDP-N-acetylmuramoylalanine--D-glutamate ligase
MGPMLKEIDRSVKKVFLLEGTGTTHLRRNLKQMPEFDTLEGAFIEAMREAQPGDVVLFSPAFASFGMFKNEYDRNDRFMALIRHLK